ncbi:coatomer subunit epsilon [Rhopalosiphum maidis]|uniref:coatomer subunit epsilon n=1 Tax=Rhopalosiphum maidis TaxID=43146 RepID=UPI000EFF8DB7|nr:coatomer subunit epsilon [Rhopalosiphum maidis]XP_026815370.1 coatomer subunit epsilon [Rhopalosiphum maidis]
MTDLVKQAESYEANELFDIKNSYYIGNYQQCINDAQKEPPNYGNLRLQRDIFMYRAYLAQKKYSIVLAEIKANSPPELKPFKLLAEYLQNPGNRNSILKTLEQELENMYEINHSLVIVAATIYNHEHNYESALRVLKNDDTLEGLTLSLIIYLRMNRVDLASKELKKLQEKDEDATLTQMAQAWLNLAIGGSKLQEAYFIFQELTDKYGITALLLNSQSVCYIGECEYKKAEITLLDALEKDSNDIDSLVNSLFISVHTKVSADVAKRQLNMLRDAYPNSDFIENYNKKEAEFDALSQSYQQ